MSPPRRPGPAIELRRLYPDSGAVSVGELVRSLEWVGRAPSDRPYTVANFVSSADGSAAFRGRSGPLGDEGDRALFRGLREQVDAVVVGTTTIRTERYGPVVREPERRQRRAAAGLSPQPLACLITRSGDVPTDVPLFADPESRIAVFTPIDISLDRCAAQVEVIRLDPGELTPTTMLRRLRWDYNVRALLCEGGPTLFGALLREDLVDELFLTLAPKLTGGEGLSIANGPPLPELQPLTLTWALERGGSLFLRYSIQ